MLHTARLPVAKTDKCNESMMSHSANADEVMLMMRRQQEFQQDPACFYYLSTDASMQRGSDYQMSLEDRVPMDRAAALYRDKFNSDEFSAAHVLRTTVLPASLIGAGNSSLPAKFESFVDAIKLDVGLRNLKLYSTRVVSFVSDYGTEAKILDVARLISGLRLRLSGLRSNTAKQLAASSE